MIGLPRLAHRAHFWCWLRHVQTSFGWVLDRFMHLKQHSRRRRRSVARLHRLGMYRKEMLQSLIAKIVAPSAEIRLVSSLARHSVRHLRGLGHLYTQEMK